MLLSGGYAYFLYRFDPRTRDFPLWSKRTLAFLRFLLILFIAFLLLKPLVRTVETETEAPVFVLAQDASASIPLGGDSTFYSEEYPDRLENLAQELGQDLEVRRFSFGKELMDSLSEGYPSKETDISRVLEGIRERFRDRDLAGVLLATDGIYNSGADPRYYAQRLGAPVHTLALGDTTVKKDLILKEVRHNRYAYKGNRFPVELVVQARKAKGEASELSILKDGEGLYQEELRFDREEDLQVRTTHLEADSSGLQEYTGQIEAIEDEMSVKNNVREFFIEVLDSKREVLILAPSPHPDIRAMKLGIESKNSYEVRTGIVDEFDGDLSELDLLILHRLPSRSFPVEELLADAEERDLSTLFVFGKGVDRNAFSRALPGMNLQEGGRTDEATVMRNSNFKDFDIGKAGQKAEEWPPLMVPFGEWDVGKGVDALFHKQLGQVSTEDPLLGFSEKGGRKFGFLMGEGLWRWRLSNMATDGDVGTFDRILTKTVQYLSTRDDKSRFRVEGEKAYKENEAIVFSAELYDESYELINEPEVRMTISNSEGRDYPFSFRRTSEAYRLDAGSLPVGDYRYRALVEWEADTLVEEGVFKVNPVQVERTRTVADHSLLFDLSEQSGGELFYPDDMERIPERIRERGDAKPVRYTQERMSDLIAWRWIFLPLLLLASLEWGLRKRLGAY